APPPSRDSGLHVFCPRRPERRTAPMSGDAPNIGQGGDKPRGCPRIARSNGATWKASREQGTQQGGVLGESPQLLSDGLIILPQPLPPSARQRLQFQSSFVAQIPSLHRR